MSALAAGQGGVVTAAQCAGAGADSTALRALLRSQRWHRARRGVYRDPTFRPRGLPEKDHHARCAAVLATLPEDSAAISHTSALRLLGLPLPPHCPTHVVITRRPPAPANRLRGDTSVHVAGYDGRDVVEVAGVPVLSGARLVADSCAVLEPDSALAVADAALRAGWVSADALRTEVARRRGRPGARMFAAVVERADPLAENWFESASRWWLLEAGLPRPRLQVRFTDGTGRVRARVDMLFAEHRTVGEADGAGKYATPGELFAEKRREDWLRDEHCAEVVRWVPSELETAAGRAGVVQRFHRAFARAARQPPSASQQEIRPEGAG